jgi:hypothetical protein
MKGRWSLAAGLTILGILAGCKDIASPSLEHPRSADIQQKRAVRYDPYAEPDVAPGMSDTRPREYQSPPAEPTRARWTIHNQSLSQFPNSDRWRTDGMD